MFAIDPDLDDAMQLSRVVVQVCDMLGMYQAELARILHLQCGDIGQLASGKSQLAPDSEPWRRARQFVRFYQLLYASCDGHEASMCNWLRRDHARLATTPLLAMVDEDKLSVVISLLDDNVQESKSDRF